MGHDQSRFPRIKKGPMTFATKDGSPNEEVDRLLTNSYMGRHIAQKPDYWPKLLRMVYGNGRLRTYTGAVENIVEKFSFLLLARDEIIDLEKKNFIETYIPH
nr:hypothetical protein [uncultured Desulfobacter sp.]